MKVGEYLVCIKKVKKFDDSGWYINNQHLIYADLTIGKVYQIENISENLNLILVTDDIGDSIWVSHKGFINLREYNLNKLNFE